MKVDWLTKHAGNNRILAAPEHLHPFELAQLVFQHILSLDEADFERSFDVTAQVLVIRILMVTLFPILPSLRDCTFVQPHEDSRWLP